MGVLRTEKNAIVGFDFTAWVSSGWTVEKVVAECNLWSKHWVFQLEACPTTGNLHYQGRMSLRKKSRKTPDVDWIWSITSIPAHGGFDYVMKDETRVEGPWDDKDQIVPLRSHIKKMLESIKPWQQRIIDISKVRDLDYINVLIDNEGLNGKTSVCDYLQYLGLSLMVPSGIEDYKVMVEFCASQKGKQVYMFDVPRALDMNKSKIFFSAIEQIKSGNLFNTRYKGCWQFIERPVVWIFCNEEVNTSLLTRKRWKLWNISPETDDLEEFRPASRQ